MNLAWYLMHPRVIYLWLFRSKDVKKRIFRARPYDLRAIFAIERVRRRQNHCVGEWQMPKPGVTGLDQNSRDDRRAIESALGKTREQKDRHLTAAEAVVLSALDFSKELRALDVSVYEAMSRLTGRTISDYRTLRNSFESWEQDPYFGLTEHAVSKLSGHLAEVQAAGHFERAGLDVSWPANSNQAGWDLLLGDHAVNVKSGANASSLEQHFEKYPDTPAVVPADASNIPDDAFHFFGHPGDAARLEEFLEQGGDRQTIVDHQLLHDALREQAEDASDLALGSLDIVDGSFPVLTVIRSSLRETRLLAEGKTTAARAAENVSIDVGAKGGGIYAGAEVGAQICRDGGPYGMLFGALVGGAIGAFFGGALADKVKKRRLRKALQEAEGRLAVMEQREREIEAETEHKIQSRHSETEQQLKSLAEQRQMSIQVAVTKLERWRLEHYDNVPKGEAQRLIKAALAELQQQVEDLHSALACSSSLRRLLWPSVEDLGFYESRYLARRSIRCVRSYAKRQERKSRVERVALYSELARWGLLKSQITCLAADQEKFLGEKEADFFKQAKASCALIAERKRNEQMELYKFALETRASARKRMSACVGAFVESWKAVRREIEMLGQKA